jgi:hypothetical protein
MQVSTAIQAECPTLPSPTLINYTESMYADHPLHRTCTVTSRPTLAASDPTGPRSSCTLSSDTPAHAKRSQVYLYGIRRWGFGERLYGEQFGLWMDQGTCLRVLQNAQVADVYK